MDNSELLKKLDRFVEVVVSKYHPDKIVLFGSYARGTNSPQSDIDVAVIGNFAAYNLLDSSADLFRIRRDIDPAIEPVMLEDGADSSGFLNEILSYGIVLFDAAAHNTIHH